MPRGSVTFLAEVASTSRVVFEHHRKRIPSRMHTFSLFFSLFFFFVMGIMIRVGFTVAEKKSDSSRSIPLDSKLSGILGSPISSRFIAVWFFLLSFSLFSPFVLRSLLDRISPLVGRRRRRRERGEETEETSRAKTFDYLVLARLSFDLKPTNHWTSISDSSRYLRENWIFNSNSILRYQKCCLGSWRERKFQIWKDITVLRYSVWERWSYLDAIPWYLETSLIDSMNRFSWIILIVLIKG